MKSFIICIILLGYISSPAFSEFTFYGKITIYDGSPPALAHVSYIGYDGNIVLEKADKDGKYSIKVQDMPSVELIFTSPDNFNLTRKFIVTSDRNSLEVNVKLKPFAKLNNIKDVGIRGSFNNDETDKIDKMTANSDGTYSFSILSKSDTLLYQVIPTFTDNDPGHSFNGTQSDYYEYDMGGDYFSVLINKTRKFNIIFEPSKYPAGDFKPEVIISDEKYSNQNKILEHINNESHKYLVARSNLMLNKDLKREEMISKNIEEKKKFLKNIENLIKDLNIKEFKQYAVIQYLSVAHDGINIDGMKDYVNKDLISDIHLISPDSDLWNEAANYYSLAFAEILLGNTENSEYLNKFLSANQPEKSKAGALSILIRYFSYQKMQVLQDKYYQKLITDYPDTKEAMQAKFEFGKEKAIKTGNRIPDFELPNLDNEKEMISPAVLAGKYVLVDVWGTWCMPCLMDLPELIKAYDKFKDKKFTIYSVAIDTGPGVVRKFRESENKFKWLKPEEQPKSNLPWLHSYGGNWESDIIRKFEVLGVPSTFLIDPEGKIIATDGLRGEELITTLEKFIK